MKQLLEDIKTGQYRQAYLLYGQEAYLRNRRAFQRLQVDTIRSHAPLHIAKGSPSLSCLLHRAILFVQINFS